MRCLISIFFLSVLFLGIDISVYASTDSTRIYFRYGYSLLEPSLRNNRQTLDGLIKRLRDTANDTAKIYLCIEGNASPSGSRQANDRLSRKRAENILAYIRRHMNIHDSLLVVKANGIDWNGLARLVEQDTTIPAREKVLSILLHPENQNPASDRRKTQLLHLQGGQIYRLLKQRFFPQLRNTTVEVRRYEAPVVCSPMQYVPLVEEFDSSLVCPYLDVRQSMARDGDPYCSDSRENVVQETVQRLAVKTNLLYDAILMPSLEVEYRINGCWTVNLEGDMAWWKKEGKHKYYQLATVSPEGRYWFKTRKPWHGHYVGLFGGFSWYDLENGKRGYKGEAVMTGMSYGYMFPIKGRLSLEAGIGVGFMHSWYEEYLPVDGHYVYQQSSKLNYFGPLKLKFALVWRLWDINKRKGGGR